METTKLASYIVKTDTNQAFAIDLTENVLAPDMISYVVTYMDLDSNNAWDDSFFETFKSAEDADKAIQDFIDKHHATIDTGLGDKVVASSSYVTETGIEHDVELVRCVSAWRSRFLDVSYEVKHAWGLADGDDLCDATHGYTVEEFDSFGAASYGFDYYTKEVIDAQ